MILSGKPTLIRFLIWANVTILVFGLLSIRKGQLPSHDQDIFSVPPTLDDQSWFSLSDSTTDPGYKGQELRAVGGFFSHIFSSFWKPKNPLCETSIEELPKHLIFKKLVECSGSAANYEGGNRRFLRSSEEETSAFEAQTTSSNTQDKDIEAAFHIDYSGPKTHPPKNN